MSKSKRTSLNGFIGQKVTVTIGGVPLEGYDASTSKQSIKEPLDEYMELVMADFLLEYGYMDASDRIKYFANYALTHANFVKANTPPHNDN